MITARWLKKELCRIIVIVYCSGEGGTLASVTGDDLSRAFLIFGLLLGDSLCNAKALQ